MILFFLNSKIIILSVSFSFFNKNAKNIYECNSSKKSNLNKLQLNYLDKLYNNYNTIRHPYSHWSAQDVDVAVIDLPRV